MSLKARAALVVLSCSLAACAGAGPGALPERGYAALALTPSASAIAVKPSKLSVPMGFTASVVVAEKGYKGRFTSSSAGKTSCKSIAQWTPRRGTGPRLTVTLRGSRLGHCTIVFADADGRKASLQVKIVTPQPGTFESVYSFAGGSDGANPAAGLTVLKGALYGVTDNGGANGYGVFFRIIPSTGKEKVLHAFGASTDGANPQGDLLAIGGELYGTTTGGGVYSVGTVFATGPSGSEKVLASTTGRVTNPQGELAAINGVLYGAASACTTYYCYNPGSVFEVNRTTGASQIVYAFEGAASRQAARPAGGVTAWNHALYGTTLQGGSSDDGTIFEVSTAGTGRLLHSFAGGSDGAMPLAGLSSEYEGKLFGTTSSGGVTGNGTVFALDVSGGASGYTTVYRFKRSPDGSDPQAIPLVLNGVLYGTTASGGKHNDGTVYSIKLATGAERVLYSFSGGADGKTPVSRLVELNGELYGTTQDGGTSGNGTVFQITP